MERNRWKGEHAKCYMLKQESNDLPKYAAGDPGLISADLTAQVNDLKVN